MIYLDKYGIEIEYEAVAGNLKRIINQVYKLLPSREEGGDWEKPLDTIMEELTGMSALLGNVQNREIFFQLLCKLEGLRKLTQEDDFELYRRTIFDCLNLVERIKKICQD